MKIGTLLYHAFCSSYELSIMLRFSPFPVECSCQSSGCPVAKANQETKAKLAADPLQMIRRLRFPREEESTTRQEGSTVNKGASEQQQLQQTPVSRFSLRLLDISSLGVGMFLVWHGNSTRAGAIAYGLDSVGNDASRRMRGLRCRRRKRYDFFFIGSVFRIGVQGDGDSDDKEMNQMDGSEPEKKKVEWS